MNASNRKTDTSVKKKKKTETSKLQIMKISLHPKPHLERKTPTTGLSSTVSAARYGKWGVGGCVTCRPSSESLGAQYAPPTSRRAWLRLDRSPSFSHARGQVARRAWTGGGGDGKLHRRWVLCFLSARQFALTFWTHRQRCAVKYHEQRGRETDAGPSLNPAFKTLILCFCHSLLY